MDRDCGDKKCQARENGVWEEQRQLVPKQTLLSVFYKGSKLLFPKTQVLHVKPFDRSRNCDTEWCSQDGKHEIQTLSNIRTCIVGLLNSPQLSVIWFISVEHLHYLHLELSWQHTF